MWATGELNNFSQYYGISEITFCGEGKDHALRQYTDNVQMTVFLCLFNIYANSIIK